jgi:hypothetical protein
MKPVNHYLAVPEKAPAVAMAYSINPLKEICQMISR